MFWYVFLIFLASCVIIFFSLRKYFRFKYGYKIKGKVISVKYEIIGIRTRVETAKITYEYSINEEIYMHTENSDASKHMFKMHCFEGEPIDVFVHKKNLKRATVISLNNYLFPVLVTSFLFFVSLLAVILLCNALK